MYGSNVSALRWYQDWPAVWRIIWRTAKVGFSIDAHLPRTGSANYKPTTIKPGEHLTATSTYCYSSPNAVRRRLDRPPLAYRLRKIHRAFLLEKMVDMISRKSQARYKNDYGKHVRFELCFAAGHYDFVEHPRLMESAADCMPFEG